MICKFAVLKRSNSIYQRYFSIESKIESLGYKLPHRPPDPKGNYIPFVKTGNLVFIAGHLPQYVDGKLVLGRLGENMTIAEGQAAAKLAAINMLATIKVACNGDFNRLVRVVKVVGLVNSTNDFLDQATVMNGTSDLFVEIFGEKGRHARSAFGTSVLPLGVPLEIEAIVEVE